MSAPVPVRSPLESYHMAAAELPVSTRLTDDPAGAIAVVEGAGRWWDAAIHALQQGAAGVVITRPRAASADVIAALEAASAGRPIILERPLLRADIAGSVAQMLRGASAFSALVIECHAPGAALEAALRDAIGWARILVGAPLELRSAASVRGRGLALLQVSGGEPVTLVFAAQPGAPDAGRIRLTSLGVTLVEFDGDETDMTVTMTDAASRRTALARFERPERLALRRAVASIAEGSSPTDLAELQCDTALAEEITT